MEDYYRQVYDGTRLNSCCDGNLNFNLYVANPFDQRPINNQYNPWCSNELILKDKALRCAAKVQPLDIGMSNSISGNLRQY